MSTEIGLVSLLHQNEALAYAAIFFLSIPEGPILTVICGALAAQGLLNPFFVYVLVVLGDVIGDSAYYALGRFGGALSARFGAKFGLTPERLENVKEYFESHNLAVLSLSKLIHGVGVAGLVVAGIVRASYLRFFLGCILVTFGQSGLLLTLDLFAGSLTEKLRLISTPTLRRQAFSELR